MRRMLVLLVTATALVLTGCAQAPAAGPNPTSPPNLTLPSVHITRTGGFAGVHDELQIDPDGRWTFTGRSTEDSGELDAASQARLAELLADPRLPEEIAGMPTIGCCDQFNYVLRIGGAEYSFEGWGESGPLLTELLDLLQQQTGF